MLSFERSLPPARASRNASGRRPQVEFVKVLVNPFGPHHCASRFGSAERLENPLARIVENPGADDLAIGDRFGVSR